MENNQQNQPDYEMLPDDNQKFDVTFKVITIGNSGVGKSCLATRATKNIFLDTYLSTIGFGLSNFNIKLGKRAVRLQIWDTCGQEDYRSLITHYYRSSSLAIIVFAINE